MSVIPTVGLFEGYEKTWYFADFWPGEYPPRFSVVSDDVELVGRADMRLGAAKNIQCPVPKLATFSPWNNKRNEADQLLYRSVTQIAAITFSGDVKVPAIRQSDDKDITLDLTPSDSMYFLAYHGEGFALYQYNNENYVINEGDFQNRAVFEEGDNASTDLWLRLPSANGGTAWVLYDDAVKTEGIIISGIERYGIANDLPDPASLSLDGVAFHSSSAELTEGSKNILDELAYKLRNVRGVKYEIAGYTDSSGASASNLALSQKRAEAVYQYLIDQHSVDASMLVAVGYGEADPIADNATPEGRTKNRRVELNLQE
jgi:OOP family OmpA-OmpF porin